MCVGKRDRQKEYSGEIRTRASEKQREGYRESKKSKKPACGRSKVNFPFSTFLRMSNSLAPLNGGQPVERNIKRVAQIEAESKKLNHNRKPLRGGDTDLRPIS